MKKRVVFLTRAIEVEVNEHATEADIIGQAQDKVQEEIDNGTFEFNSTEVRHAEFMTSAG